MNLSGNSHIVFLSHHFYPTVSGIANHVLNLATVLRLAGHKVTVLTCDNNTRDTLPIVDNFREISIVRVRYPSAPLRKIRLALRYLGALCTMQPPPTLIVGVTIGQYGVLSAVGGRLLQVPSMTFTMGFDVDQIAGFVGHMLNWLSVKGNRLVCGVNSDHCRYLSELVPGKRISMLRNTAYLPCKLAESAGELKASGPECLKVLFIGRLDESKHGGGVKGLEYALEACEVTKGVCLRVIGHGPKLDDYRSMTRSRGLADRVIFLGQVPHAEVLRYMAGSDAVLIVSLHEGLPLVMIESMMMGSPVIATAVGAMKDYIQHGVNGLLVPPRDSQAIAWAIEKLRDSPELRQKLGQASRASYCKWFAPDAIARQFEDLLAPTLITTT